MISSVRGALVAYWQSVRERIGRGCGMFPRIDAEDEQDRQRFLPRARFWEEMRAGQQEAEARSRPQQ